MKAKCSEIKVGNRIRKELGDIEDLANNIKELGLLQPIGITKDNELVFGERRLAACKSLDYEEIEVVIIDSDNLLECETTENVNRKNFIMSERVEIRKIFKDKFIKENGKLMAKGIKIKKTDPKLGSKLIQNRLAKLSGVSHATADKENVIVAFDNQEIINQVDNNELSVSKAYSMVKKLKKEAEEIKTNNTDTLPVEESVEVEIETVEVDDDIYTITITDNYGSLIVTEPLKNKLKHYAKVKDVSTLTIIENLLEEAFKNYTGS